MYVPNRGNCSISPFILKIYTKYLFHLYMLGLIFKSKKLFLELN